MERRNGDGALYVICHKVQPDCQLGLQISVVTLARYVCGIILQMHVSKYETIFECVHYRFHESPQVRGHE
jgi:hypothetical protein